MESRLEKRENIIIDKWIYPAISVSQQQDSTANKMLTKGFHYNYFVIRNPECQDILLYGNQVQDLASLCCTYKEVQSFKSLNASSSSYKYSLWTISSEIIAGDFNRALVDTFTLFYIVPCWILMHWSILLTNLGLPAKGKHVDLAQDIEWWSCKDTHTFC